MPNYIKFNFDYNKQTLLDIFNNSEKTTLPRRNRATLPSGIAASTEFQSFFERFPFVPKYDDSLDIVELPSDGLPKIYPSINGHLLFPISGDVSLKTYEFKFADASSTWAYAIKVDDILTTPMINDIERTLLETVVIDSPIAINSQNTHSFQTTGCIFLLIKIPPSISWDDIVTALSV